MFLFAEGDSGWERLIPRLIAGVLIFLCTTALSYLIGMWWGRRQAWLEWTGKQFLGRINISVNSLRDGTLRIRTVMERSLQEVFLNPVAIQKVRLAAGKTSATDPILPIDKPDRWFLLNFVLNAVVEHFTDGVIRQDVGVPVRTVKYVMFLVCEETGGEDRLKKVRALMIQEDLLREFPHPEPGSYPRLEVDYHKDRVDTLRLAAQKYRTDADLFIKLEVCLP